MEKATIYDYVRMCKSINKCEDCPLGVNNNETELSCSFLVRETSDKANEIILNWCKEHPVETRQDRFLKMFPNAAMTNGVINIFPCLVDNTQVDYDIDVSCASQHGYDSCAECRKKYWLTEVK